jgi:hypothetical protein
MSSLRDNSGVYFRGHIKICDVETNEVLLDKCNSIHSENMSIAIANALANTSQGWFSEIAFGNGGASVDPSGVITYLPPNASGPNASLYNQTYYKVIDASSYSNTNPSVNNVTVRHVPGVTYTDIVISCVLDYGEPQGQDAFDNTVTLTGPYVFSELGIKAWNGDTIDQGLLLSHVCFSPIQKSLNRSISVNYTIRINALNTLSN